MSNQYANTAGGSFVQNYTNQVGSSHLPVNQPLNQMYQPGRAPLGPQPSSGGPPLIRPTHPLVTANHDVPLAQHLLRDSEGLNTGSSGDRSVAPDNYDAVEGGGEIMQPIQQGLKTRRTLGHSYPSLPPGYQNLSSPGIPGGQLANIEGPQQFSQAPHFNQLVTGMGGLSLQQGQQSEAATLSESPAGEKHSAFNPQSKLLIQTCTRIYRN